jgi:hypothetical protein
VTYHLSWADFEAYLRRRAASPEVALPPEAAGEALARTYIWNRFLRCHRPVRPRSLFPKARSCDPAVFVDPAHWNNVYQRLVRLRLIDARAMNAIDATLFGPSEYDDLDPWDLVADPTESTEGEAVTRLEVEHLGAAIVDEFNTDVPYGPELQQAMLEATYDLATDFGDDYFESVKASLVEQLPDVFDPGPAGRQRLKRAIDRSRSFVRGVLQVQ